MNDFINDSDYKVLESTNQEYNASSNIEDQSFWNDPELSFKH